VRGWYFQDKGKLVTLRVRGNLDCNDGELLHRWAEVLGLAWGSTWKIQAELLTGTLVTVLDEYAIQDYNMGAGYAQQQRNVPAKVRSFIEHLKRVYLAAGVLGDVRRA